MGGMRLFAVGIILSAGCGRAGNLTLHCGAGLQLPVAELVGIFQGEQGIRIEADYAGSEVLLSKIKISRSGDVYMPGEKHYLDMAAKEGFILDRKTVCYFVPAILVAKGNPRKIGGLRDLVRPGLKLGLGEPRVPAIGRQTRLVMEKNGIEWTAVEKNTVFWSMTVNELGLQIQAGSVDAAVVWDAVAVQYERYGDTIPIPPEQNIVSTIEAGVLAFSKDRDRARRFVEFLASGRGREVFRKHRYRVDPP